MIVISYFFRATLKGLTTEQHFDKTFTSDEIVEHASLHHTKAQYNWTDGENYNFMDSETYEEIVLSKDDVTSDVIDFLYEGLEVRLNWYDNKVISVELPLVMEMEVVSFDEKAMNKTAILKSGLSIPVPDFILKGGRVRVNTVDKEYIDRA